MSFASVNAPEPARLKAYPSQTDLEPMLLLFQAGTAYRPGPVMASLAAPQASAELGAWLDTHRPLPFLVVNCVCGYRLDKWHVDGHHVMPYRPRAGQPAQSGVVPYTVDVAAGRGSIKSSHTGDAKGTYTQVCKRCGKETPLRAETRMRLYLSALFDNERIVVLPPVS